MRTEPSFRLAEPPRVSAEAAPGATAIRTGSLLAAFAASARPKQWTKNLIVFGPLVFAHDLFSPALVTRAVQAFIAFCLVSSAAYVVNDLLDVENDRQHPTKCFRPIASGQLGLAQAVSLAVSLAAAGLALAFAVDVGAGLAAAAYSLLMLAYSTALKHLAIIDVFAIAAGFILRAVAGALAIHVVISPWLYVCTLLLALFLGFSKRYNELLVLQDSASSHRRSLEDYSPELLRQIIGTITATMVMAYSLYTFSASSVPSDHSMMLTIPFVLYGIFRYQYLVHHKQLGGAPELVLLRDVPLALDIVLWGLTSVAVLYFAA